MRIFTQLYCIDPPIKSGHPSLPPTPIPKGGGVHGCVGGGGVRRKGEVGAWVCEGRVGMGEEGVVGS